MELQLEKHGPAGWELAATVTLLNPSKGIHSTCVVEYTPSYALAHLNEQGPAQLSVHYPINFNHIREPVWAPILLDILPSGFGRDILAAQLNLARPDGPQHDTTLLQHGASNPAGNMRVKEAYAWLQSILPAESEAWLLEDLNRHDADFIEYARVHGALVGGTSTQGQAAKIWLTQRNDGKYQADCMVADDQAAQHFMVKIPRNQADASLLRHEAYWLELAQVAGLDVHGKPFSHGDLLFIPRFDRAVIENRVVRKSMESAYSLLGVAAHGAPLCHEDILTRWVPFANRSRLGRDLLEYLKRDVLSYCLRVEDNHGRNTSFFHTPAGLELTPLYDFAPMFLCEDPPVRSTTWRTFPIGRHNEWMRLFDEFFPKLIGAVNSQALQHALSRWATKLPAVAAAMSNVSLDPRAQGLAQRITAVQENLL